MMDKKIIKRNQRNIDESGPTEISIEAPNNLFFGNLDCSFV